MKRYIVEVSTEEGIKFGFQIDEARFKSIDDFRKHIPEGNPYRDKNIMVSIRLNHKYSERKDSPQDRHTYP